MTPGFKPFTVLRLQHLQIIQNVQLILHWIFLFQGKEIVRLFWLNLDASQTIIFAFINKFTF